MTAWTLLYLTICIRYLVSLRSLAVPGITDVRRIFAESVSVVAALFSIFTMFFIYLAYPSVSYWCPNADMLMVPFVNTLSLYDIMVKEVYNLMRYTYSYLNNHLYDIKRIICVVLYLCFQAFVVLYTIENIGTKTVEVLSNTDEFVSSTLSEHQNSITLFHFAPKIMHPNGTKGENISGTIQIYHSDTYPKKTMFLSERSVTFETTDERNNSSPIPAVEHREEIKRIIGEDVELHFNNHKMSLVVRKPDFCICENKGKDREAA